MLLFLLAGQCVARFLGLAIGAAVLLLYMQGVTVEDAWAFVEQFGSRLSAAEQAFRTSEVS